MAGRCSCWLGVGFPTGPLLLQAPSLTARVALTDGASPDGKPGQLPLSGDRILQRLLPGLQCCASPGAALEETGLWSLSSEELSQGLLMALSEPLRTAVLSCARGTHTVGLLQEAAAWHPTGAEGGLKESWVRTPQGFPEQGWRSAVNPWRQIIESMHATVRLALHIPEAGGLVWVVDGQADSSDVLQSLCCTSEKVVLGG